MDRAQVHGAEKWRRIVEELLDADAVDYPGKEEDKLRASFKAKCKQAWLSRWDALLRFTAELLKCKRQGGVSHRALGVAKDTTEARLIVRYFNRHVGPFPLENGQARLSVRGCGCPFPVAPLGLYRLAAGLLQMSPRGGRLWWWTSSTRRADRRGQTSWPASSQSRILSTS